MKPLDEMTPEEIRLEIAERKGWTIIDIERFIGAPDRSGLSAFYECQNWPASIAAAWELVTSLVEDQPLDRFSVDYNGLVDTKWRASFSFIHKIYSEVADTAPLAICKSWLAWKRKED